MIIAVFWCRHRDTVYFVGIYLVLSKNTHNAGYSDKSAVVFIIYRAPNRGAITGVILP